MPFFEKNFEQTNETDEYIFGNKIIILKKVKSLKQLRRTEKELVKLNYKEAIIKGFTLKGIQQYISKTKDMDRVVLLGIPKKDRGAGMSLVWLTTKTFSHF